MGLFKKKVSEPGLIYETKYGFGGPWIKVFPDRVDFFMTQVKSIPINQIASIQLGEISLVGHMKIIIETTGGQRYKIFCKDKVGVKNAIYQAQSMSRSTPTE